MSKTVKDKQFIAIESVIINNRLIGLVTSTGKSIINENGLELKEGLDWLFNLVHLRKRVGGIVFCYYNFVKSNEFLFSGLPSALRDKLFGSFFVRRRVDQLEMEREDTDNILYNKFLADNQEFQRADFERHVINHSLAELQEVIYGAYKIELINGKMLTLSKKGKSITFYDIKDFFKGDTFDDVVTAWLGRDYAYIGHCLDISNDRESDWCKSGILASSFIKAGLVGELITFLWKSLTHHNINLSRFHGAGAIASHILGTSKAKSEFYNYRFKRQQSPELWKAIHQAYYAGRAEQFIIGTAADVKVYDINSAYAHAISFLPILLQKPRFAKQWNDAPFSLWYCEYDFTSVSPYFGYLPNRDINNATKFKVRGRGYFWQPEIVFLLQHYPQCLSIKHGYVWQYVPAQFTETISAIYDLRKDLRTKNDPLQKVLGLGLSAIYGKFKREKSHYYNLSYAGFITSFTRYQLLEATKDNENATLCFQTDAIHSLADLPLNLGPNCGEYKLKEYARITYLDNGVYRCYDKYGQTVKTKTRGFKSFDFTNAVKRLQRCNSYSAVASFFVGHNLYVQKMFKGANYLDTFAVEKESNPLSTDKDAMRIFVNRSDDLDLTTGYIDSRINDSFSGRESAAYRKVIFTGADVGI